MTTTITAKQLKIARFFSLAFMFAAMFTNHFLDFIGFFVISMAVVLKEIRMEKAAKAQAENTAIKNSVGEPTSAMPIRNSGDNATTMPVFKPTKVTQTSTQNVENMESTHTRS